MAIIRDAKVYSPERYNAACRRALQIGSPTRFSLRSILKKGLDHAALPDDVDPPPGPFHDNVRGPVFQKDPGPCAGGSTDLV